MTDKEILMRWLEKVDTDWQEISWDDGDTCIEIEGGVISCAQFLFSKDGSILNIEVYGG